MTVDPGAGAIEGPTELTVAPAALDKLARAYIATYHGPHGDAPTVDTVSGPIDMSAPGKLMSPALLAAHYRLGRQPKGRGDPRRVLPGRRPWRLRSCAANRHRLRVDADGLRDRAAAPARRGVQGDHEPGAAGAAQPDGDLLDIQPASEAGNFPRGRRRGVDPYTAVAARSIPRRWRRPAPVARVLADARQVAIDSRALTGTLLGLANELDNDPEGRFPGPDRKDVARCCAGSPTGTSCCWGTSGAR